MAGTLKKVTSLISLCASGKHTTKKFFFKKSEKNA